MYALSRIGTDSVIEAVSKVFPDANSHFRSYASDVFRRIHSDLSVKRALEFLEKEEDYGIRTMLGMALLNNFAYDGLEAVRKLIIHGTYEPFITDLQEDLITACTIMGERIPEYDEWKEAVVQRQAEADERKGSFFNELTWSTLDEVTDHQTSGNIPRKIITKRTLFSGMPLKSAEMSLARAEAGRNIKNAVLGKNNSGCHKRTSSTTCTDSTYCPI